MRLSHPDEALTLKKALVSSVKKLFFCVLRKHGYGGHTKIRPNAQLFESLLLLNKGFPDIC